MTNLFTNFIKSGNRKVSLRLITALLFSSLFFCACKINNLHDVYQAVQTTRVATKVVKGFSPQQDVKLGKNVSLEIEKNTAQYPLFSKAENPEAYAYINKLVNNILESEEIQYKDKFPWEVKIIDKNVLNAFALPGGYIYVYTGLVNYLDSESELIGVLGHEVAHSDRRHHVRQFRKSLGLSVLIQVALGDIYYVRSFTRQLLQLKFTRSFEKEADEYSVRYLCSTDYDATGAAGFFDKLDKQGGERPNQWLSTHPAPENRVEAIHNHALKYNCQTESKLDDNYQAIKQYFK